MAIGTFSVGQRLRRCGEAFRITRDIGDGQLVIEELKSGGSNTYALVDLLDEWKRGDLHFEGGKEASSPTAAAQSVYQDALFQSYPAELVAEAKTKLVYVTKLESLPRTQSVMKPIIDGIWADTKLWKGMEGLQRAPHPTTVSKWIRNFRESQRDLRSLVSRDAIKGHRAPRVADEVSQMVEDAIELEYLTLERPPLKEIHRTVKGQVALRNRTRPPSQALRAPSYDYLKKRVRELDAYDVYRARYGKRAADIKFRASGAGVITEKPLARACMDHTKLDLFVIDDETYLPLGRPWLTLILDEHCRYVLGYYLGFEEPSSVSMTRALRAAIAPKDQDADTKCRWDAWGIMDVLVVDQAREFHGKILEEGAGRYGITIQYCPRRKPWFKGKIERYFGTLNTGLLSSLQGKTFSSIELRGDYDPAKSAVITLTTLRRMLKIWIVDVYHHDIHRSLGMPPQKAWEEGIAGVGLSGPVDRFLPPSSIEMDAAFSATDTRKLTHKGIEFDCLFYNSEELGALRCQWGSEIVVEVRVQDDDLGSIVVVAPDGSTIIKVPAVDQQYAANLTRWQHKVCKRFKQRALEDDERDIGLLDAKRRIRALIEADMLSGGRGSKSSTRSRQQRFLEQEGEPLLATAETVDPQGTDRVSDNKPPPANATPRITSFEQAVGDDADDDEIPDMPTTVKPEVEQ